MYVLGLEGTAHTLGVGIIDGGFNCLSDVKKTYQPRQGGINPRDASQYMAENMQSTVIEALSEAGIGLEDLSLVSFSQGPGLGPCLRTVATAARTISLAHEKPILGVNHCVAHIEVGRVFGGVDKPLVVYVSGANTQVIRLNEGRYRVFGETLDIGLGNMLDKFGRYAGLPHPAGPKIEKLARQGEKYIPLPYVVKGTDLSFSGLLTAAQQKHQRGESLEHVCFSLQETSFSMLCEVAERALAHLKADSVLLTGGVGNNKRLQEMLILMASEHDAQFTHPKGFMGDNGTMIAIAALKMHKAGVKMTLEDTQIESKQRTDDIKISW
ncbi:MAG: bifunctional N(6)-L-threonylcarbamoyladenine synthase/serine/threonine protein kinase [Candidatus Altiarchaeales archaeon]|nr:bifunctional N(6)-L-threonylcarbamoyladenine synthase/serine/threonine protein kinase [Candidatus Altiarchaeales archaeon]